MGNKSKKQRDVTETKNPKTGEVVLVKRHWRHQRNLPAAGMARTARSWAGKKEKTVGGALVRGVIYNSSKKGPARKARAIPPAVTDRGTLQPWEKRAQRKKRAAERAAAR